MNFEELRYPPSPHFNVGNALVFLKQSLWSRKPQETTLSRGEGGKDILTRLEVQSFAKNA